MPLDRQLAGNQGLLGFRRHVGLGLLLLACLFPFAAIAQPVITQQPVSQTTRLGSTVTFTVQASGTPPLVFQWRKNGVNVPGATGPALALTSVDADDGGSYTVAISDGVAAVESDTATLTIENLSFLQFADNFANRTPLPGLLNLGGTVRGSNVGATSEANEPLHDGKRGGSSVWVSWRSPLLILAGIATVDTAGSGFDTMLAIYRGDSLGNLTLIASDDDRGGYLNSAIRFNVEPNTEYVIAIDGRAGQQGDITLAWSLEIVESLLNLLPVITLQPKDLVVQNSGSGLLQVEFTSLLPPQVQWLHHGSPVPGANANSMTLQNILPNHVGEYVAEISTLTRRVVSKPGDIQINDTDGGVLGVKAFNKFYDSTDDVQAVAQARAGLEKASRKGSRIRKQSTGPASGYTGTQIFSTFGSTREAGEPNHCGVLGGASEWYSYAPPTNGLMTVDTDGSDFDTVLAVYTLPAGLPITFENLQSVTCDNNSGHNGQTSKVTFDTTTNGVCYIAVDGVGGAQGTVWLNYQLRVPPFIIQQPAGRAVTMGENVSFTVSAGGVPAPAFRWQFNGADIAAATNTSVMLTNIQPAHAGMYRAVVSNSVGVVTSVAAPLTVIEPPSIGVQPQSQTVVAGATVPLNVEVSGTAPFGFQWRLGGVEIPAATNQTLSLINVQPFQAGEYSVVVSNTAGAVTSSNALLAVLVPPVIRQHPQSQTAYAGTDIQFSVVADGTEPLSFQWLFNGAVVTGESNSTLSLTNVRLCQAGNYSIVVSNMAGTATSPNAVLTVTPEEPLEFVLSEHSPDGTFRLGLRGAPLQNALVQVSTDLVNWLPIFTNFTQTNVVEVIDSEATNYAARFYRAVR